MRAVSDVGIRQTTLFQESRPSRPASGCLHSCLDPNHRPPLPDGLERARRFVAYPGRLLLRLSILVLQLLSVANQPAARPSRIRLGERRGIAGMVDAIAFLVSAALVARDDWRHRARREKRVWHDSRQTGPLSSRILHNEAIASQMRRSTEGPGTLARVANGRATPTRQIPVTDDFVTVRTTRRVVHDLVGHDRSVVVEIQLET